MLKFNAAGLLIPPTVIMSNLKEFEEYFAIDSLGNIRKSLFNQFTIYVKDLKIICAKDEFRQWIEGSFVTKKPYPFDIDFVTFIDYELAGKMETELKQFIYPASSVNYGLDGYVIVVYPESHKLHFAYKADCSYWINHFDKTKPGKRHKRIPKGFLEIIV